MIFKTLPQISHLCFLKIHKFFIYSSWKLKIIFKTFATNFTFIIFKSHTLSWDRKNLFLVFIHLFSLLESDLQTMNFFFSACNENSTIIKEINFLLRIESFWRQWLTYSLGFLNHSWAGKKDTYYYEW